MKWDLSYSYLDLPGPLFTRQRPIPVSNPRLAVFNHDLARDLGLGEVGDGDQAILAGNAIPPGGQPFSQAYAGHQYGHFTLLGDGRAVVLGEHRTPDGQLVDLQLKGSGRTPYSRGGDGRAALGPMLREYLVSEAMDALGIPSTRALAVVETGETVQRESALPGAVLSRVGASHLRVGTFELAAATGDPEILRALMDYATHRHFPSAAQADHPAAAFLDEVIGAQARLIAQWMAVGFVHGVMNTDNMAISGQTIDYGPCAFLDTYRPDQVYSSIDRHGRYAYGNQPGVAQWNLARLAEALLPLVHPDPAQAVTLARGLVGSFGERYEAHYHTLMARKLGLPGGPGATELVTELLGWMEGSGADYPATFRTLTDTGTIPGVPAQWLGKWKAQASAHGGLGTVLGRMAGTNPVYHPRNHQVEKALSAAVSGNYGPFHRLLGALRSPFGAKTGLVGLSLPPGAGELEPYVTYCGT